MRRPTVRRPLVTAAILIACGLAAPLHAEGTAQQNAAPKAENGSAPAATSAQENKTDNRKTSGSNDQSGPSNAAATSDQNKQGDNATHSTAGRAGTEEPGSHAPSQDTAVFVNGALNVPGAPARRRWLRRRPSPPRNCRGMWWCRICPPPPTIRRSPS